MKVVRLALFILAVGLVAGLTPARAGITPFTDPGKIDFDSAMEMLNPYGTWAQVDGKWAFTPLDHQAPYIRGRWLYTEYGWYWQGTSPHSWLTEHYGYWKRGADKVWAWYPGPVWLPQIVEIRGSPAGIGWRSAEVDQEGNFVEPPSVRYTKVDEWTFVTPAQFAGPITPQIAAKPAQTEQMLEESTDSVHSYLTYREIDRPGPHPADFINLGDGGMFAPMTPEERAKALHPLAQAKPAPAKPGAPISHDEAAKLAASLSASEAAPEIPQQPGADDPNDDPRQVKYWVTMSLPTRWTPAPADAKPDQIYIYRPDFYQDGDGIERRVAFWLNPSLRTTEAIHLQDVLNHRPAVAATGLPASSAAAIPAVPVHDFSSPFEDPFRDTGSTKRPGATTAPSPVNLAGAPTNSPAPAGTAIPAAGAAGATPAAPAPAGRAP
jgi:hypothetical protein